jgi:2'-5' RNA ligase
MSPLPTQMRNRWENRPEPVVGHGTVYWHVLFQDQPQVSETAKLAQGELARFGGFHMTPEKWLHMTAHVAGPAEEISSDQMRRMLAEAQDQLSYIEPISVRLGRVLYHPEAVMLGVDPADALNPIYRAARHATRAVLGDSVPDDDGRKWTPHITVSYSTTEQSAEPIVATLGKELPGCNVVVSALTLVIQWGPERLWDWEPVGVVKLGTAA